MKSQKIITVISISADRCFIKIEKHLMNNYSDIIKQKNYVHYLDHVVFLSFTRIF